MNTTFGRKILYGSVALAAGVLGWLAFESLQAGREIPAGQQLELEQRSESNLQAMQQQLEQSLAGQTAGAAQERMNSRKGQVLFRLCTEWTEFHDNHPSENARRERDAACGRLKAWVDDGADPGE